MVAVYGLVAYFVGFYMGYIFCQREHGKDKKGCGIIEKTTSGSVDGIGRRSNT